MKRLILCVMVAVCIGGGPSMAGEPTSGARLVDETARTLAVDVCEVQRAVDVFDDPHFTDQLGAVDAGLTIECGNGACCVIFTAGDYCCVSCDDISGCRMDCNRNGGKIGPP
jgi:hypothetical protein